jgi:hypothetical protein
MYVNSTYIAENFMDLVVSKMNPLTYKFSISGNFYTLN